MARKTITVKCKNCGKEFSYSEEAYKLKSEEGQDKPERCSDCSRQNASAVRSTNSPYFHFKKGGREIAEFGSFEEEFAFKGRPTQKEEARKR